MNQKIKEHHLSRKAILYVRQSSQHQVENNKESRRLQYAMAARLKDLGWPEVDIIDEDLGKSASGAVDRSGFERMVAEVCLGQVGAVAAREVSRFARNSHDWQQLIEVCRMVGTVLVDHEAVYDTRLGNDRLLLGLKGSLNEYELDILRMRSLEARRQKARRGDLVLTVPIGYIKTIDGRMVKDPDRRVGEALSLVYAKFFELGSVRQTLLWFLSQGLELPMRRHSAAGWETGWRRATYSMVMSILKRPVYAGVYAYGKTDVEIEFRDGVPRKRIRNKPVEEWISCIYDHHESYIDRDQFDQIQQMIAQNSRHGIESGAGAARTGPALLTGILRCRHCGRKLTVVYTGRDHHSLRYSCCRGALDSGEPRCINFGGALVDEAVAREVLRVVSPGGVEAARKASEEEACGHDDVVSSLSLAAEESRYATDRAWRQYDAIDPENRLVAAELERRWNVELEKLEGLELRIAEEVALRERDQPSTCSSFEDLASDLSGIWNDSETDVRLKKRIVRALIEEIVVAVDAPAGVIKLTIHWKGGVHTEIEVKRRRRGHSGLHTPTDVVDAVEVLARICTDDTIASVLSRNGLLTGHGNRWTRERVRSLRAKRKMAGYSEERRDAEGWMNLTQAAAYVDLAPVSLRRVVERGGVPAMHPMPEGPWVFQREDLDDPGARRAFRQVQNRRQGGGVQDPGQLSLFESTLCPDEVV